MNKLLINDRWMDELTNKIPNDIMDDWISKWMVS